MSRTMTEPVRDPETGVKTVTVHRYCNGCGRDIGDATREELELAVQGRALPDVRGECGCTDELYTPPEAHLREMYAFAVQLKIAGKTFGAGLAEFDRAIAQVKRSAVLAAADELENHREFGGAYGQQLRRPSNFGRAAEFVRRLAARGASDG